jgi:hypothetical protein
VRRKFVYRPAITSDVSETQWISMLINFNSTFDAGGNWASFELGWVGDVGAFNNQDHGVSVLAVGVESGSRKPFFLTTNDAQGIEENQVGASPLTADATHLLLLKIASEDGSSLYDEITMWVDPDLSAGEAGLTGGLAGRGIIRDDGSGNPQPFSGLRLGCKTGGGGGVAFDEFRVGTTFEDVTSGSEPPPPIPGDANRDNVVNDEDASILAAHWQQPGGWSDGDFNNDNVVNDEDASILAAHWQETREGTAPVPEPGSIVLLTGAVLSLLFWRRRR